MATCCFCCWNTKREGNLYLVQFGKGLLDVPVLGAALRGVGEVSLGRGGGRDGRTPCTGCTSGEGGESAGGVAIFIL